MDARRMNRSVTGRLAAAAVVLCSLVAGCATLPPRPNLPDTGFTNGRPMGIAASSVELVKDFKPSFKAPEVEHLVPVPPELAIENWVHDRLIAAGSGGRRVVVHIVDARIRETALPKTQGLVGVFKTDQSERYDGNFE